MHTHFFEVSRIEEVPCVGPLNGNIMKNVEYECVCGDYMKRFFYANEAEVPHAWSWPILTEDDLRKAL